jgi:hypothetical protein
MFLIWTVYNAYLVVAWKRGRMLLLERKGMMVGCPSEGPRL